MLWCISFPGGSVVTVHLQGRSPKRLGIVSLGQEDPLEEGTASHSSILAWRIPWTEEPSGLHSIGSQRVRYN